jgi:hypothetical protein
MQKIWKRAIGAVSLSVMAIATTTANAYESPSGGQHFDKGRFPRTLSNPKTGQEITCPGPECTPEFVDDAVQRGQITPKDAKVLRKIQSNPPSVARNKSGTIKTDPNIAARNKTSWWIPAASALAVVGGVLAVTSGDDKPASPN